VKAADEVQKNRKHRIHLTEKVVLRGNPGEDNQYLAEALGITEEERRRARRSD
jgi:hypothetical protein